jgi:hypothetical protein
MKQDLDIRYEGFEADEHSDLQDELWRRLYDELFAPDADECGDELFQDNFQKVLEPARVEVKYTYSLFGQLEILAGLNRNSSSLIHPDKQFSKGNVSRITSAERTLAGGSSASRL